VNWPYVHTLINHFPIILTVVGTSVVLLALIVRRRGFWLYGLATLTLAGLSVYPAFFTGDQAAHAVERTWYIMRPMVEEHDDAAAFALGSLLLMGAVSAYAWWRMLRREVTTLPPVWLRATVAIIAVWALSVVARTAYLGGQIVHDSPKLQTPPAGAIPPG
jgi:uncharacterized membrane protein